MSHYTDAYIEEKIVRLDQLEYELSELELAVTRVRELHSNNNGFCPECLVGRVVDPDHESHWVYEEYPCPTIRELDGNGS